MDPAAQLGAAAPKRPGLLAAMGRFPIGPLAWIIVTPLATVPATAAVTAALTPAFSQSYPSLEALEAAAAANPYCTVHISIGAEAILGIVAANAVCPDGYVLAALSPGLLNLVPLLWLLSRRVEIRRAAIIASILGGLRFVIPSLAVLTLAPPSDYGHVARGFTIITTS